MRLPRISYNTHIPRFWPTPAMELRADITMKSLWPTQTTNQTPVSMESSDLSTNQLQLTSDPQHRHLVQPAWQRSTTPGGQTAFVTTSMLLGNADMALGMKDTITNARKTSEAMEARCAILLCCVVLPCSGRLLCVWTNVRRHPWICRFLTSLTSSY